LFDGPWAVIAATRCSLGLNDLEAARARAKLARRLLVHQDN
jgi:hypothetical protein